MELLPFDIICEWLNILPLMNQLRFMQTCSSFYNMHYIFQHMVALKDIKYHSKRHQFIKLSHDCYVRDMAHAKCIRIMHYDEKQTDSFHDGIQKLRIDSCDSHIHRAWPDTLQVLIIRNMVHELRSSWPIHLHYLNIKHVNLENITQWPETLTTLLIEKCKISIFPSNLTRLVMSRCICDFKIKLPESLNIFTCIGESIQYDYVWPIHLKQLALLVNQSPVIQNIPCELTHLHLRACVKDFNLKSFQHLTSLKLSDYDKPLQVPLPNTLMYLHLQKYNQSFKYALPESLIELLLLHYNKPLKYALPSSLKIMDLFSYNYKFKHALPSSLEKLCMHSYNHAFIMPWPSRLTHLKLSCYNIPCEFPDSLIDLHLTYFNQPIKSLPLSLKNLYMHFYNYTITKWPECIETITLNFYRKVVPPYPKSLITALIPHGIYSIEIQN